MVITLKAARVNAGLTQKQASAMLGISKGTLASYEAYKTSPSVELAKKIAELYNTTVEAIKF